MSKPRFSLRWLMGAMSFLAVSFGLLVYARPITGCCAFGVTIFVLFTSIPLSVYRSGERRAFWFGFALFGLGYLVLVCGPWQAPDVHIQVGVRERLPTTKLLELAHTWLPTKPAPPGGGGMGGGGMGGGGMGGGGMFGQMGMGGMGRLARTRVPTAEWEDFVVIGQSLWAILFAVAGGIIAQRCQRSAA